MRVVALENFNRRQRLAVFSQFHCVRRLRDGKYEVTLEVLAQYRLAGKRDKVKVLGEGTLDRKVTVRAHAFSAGARTKIEAAGGTAELLES